MNDKDSIGIIFLICAMCFLSIVTISITCYQLTIYKINEVTNKEMDRAKR